MSLLDEESVKVIMAVAVFAGIVFLLFSLFSPVFNVADETAKSYFESFEKAVDEVPSSFFMMDNGKDELNFYLVYFGNINSFERDSVRFTRDIDGLDNVICVCSEDGDNMVCNYCKGMDLPVRFFYKDDGQYAVDSWSIGEGRQIKLNKDVEKYAFSG